MLHSHIAGFSQLNLVQTEIPRMDSRFSPAEVFMRQLSIVRPIGIRSVSTCISEARQKQGSSEVLPHHANLPVLSHYSLVLPYTHVSRDLVHA